MVHLEILTNYVHEKYIRKFPIIAHKQRNIKIAFPSDTIKLR